MKLSAISWLPMLLFLTACSGGGDLDQLELKKKIIESIAGSDEMAIAVGPIMSISEPTRPPLGAPESTSSWEYREVQVKVELREATFKMVGLKKSHPGISLGSNQQLLSCQNHHQSGVTWTRSRRLLTTKYRSHLPIALRCSDLFSSIACEMPSAVESKP